MRSRFQFFCKISIVIGILFFPFTCFSEDKAPVPPTPDSTKIPIILPTVMVEATRLDPLTGASTLSRELIDEHPNRSDSVNELLSIMPGIQFSEEKDSSFTGGEILPPNLSISGGRINDNSFLIDGIGNNSFLDPLYDEPSNPSNIPGHPQEIFLGTSLIEQITVYEHNIPARLGGFTGGVIETETRDPSPEFEAKIHFSTTNDDWTHFFVDPADKEEFYNSDSVDQQPNYNKYFTNGEMSIPLSPHSGILASYEQRYSQIPLSLLTQEVPQTRTLETYFLKYLFEPSETDSLRITAIYSPYEEKQFLKDTKDSFFTLNNDALAITTNYKRESFSGDFDIKMGYHISQDDRKAPSRIVSWAAVDSTGAPTSKDWGLLIDNKFSKEGGLGDLKRAQHSMTFNSDWKSAALIKGRFSQTFNLGFGLEKINASLERTEDAISYISPKFENVTCTTDDDTCIEGEQFLSRRSIYSANKTDVDIFQYNLFVEDRLTFRRLVLRPGARYSYDDLMENHNIAPRLATSIDLFGNQKTLLIAGLNRYFDRSILTYRIREGILPSVQQDRSFDSTTGTLTPWTDRASVSPLDTKFSKLQTPYSDEQSFGIDQELFGGRLLTEYVKRNYHDQLAKEIDPYDSTEPYKIRHIWLNNNGSSNYKSYRLAWERQWTQQFISINLTHEETESSNESYDDTFNDESLTQQIWYQGHLIFKSELPRDNYSRTWTANLTWITQLPYNMTFTNVTKYQSDYKRLDDTSQNGPDGNDIYDQVTKPSLLVFDWKLSWRSSKIKRKSVKLGLDIYNVFNRENPIGTKENQFRMGRQFWANAEISF